MLDAATGEECPPARFDDRGRLLNAEEAIGELVSKGGGAGFEGYWRNEEAQQTRLREGWYWTGDLAYRDEKGFFYFAGRDHDWLRVDGENFASAPIERILQRHPDIGLAAVYAVPDPVVGDQVMAAVQLRPGLDHLDGDGLPAFLAAQGDLGTKWAPRFVRMTVGAAHHGDQQGAQARPAGRAVELRRPRPLATREGRPLPDAQRATRQLHSRQRWAIGRSERVQCRPGGADNQRRRGRHRISDRRPGPTRWSAPRCRPSPPRAPRRAPGSPRCRGPGARPRRSRSSRAGRPRPAGRRGC